MEISTEDQRIFLEVKEKIVNDQIIRAGIGTLQEKTVNAIFKHYLIPFTEYHEVTVGNYIADIFFEGEIIEIQT